MFKGMRALVVGIALGLLAVGFGLGFLTRALTARTDRTPATQQAPAGAR